MNGTSIYWGMATAATTFLGKWRWTPKRILQYRCGGGGGRKLIVCFGSRGAAHNRRPINQSNLGGRTEVAVAVAAGNAHSPYI